jgi:hypothetical protein
MWMLRLDKPQPMSQAAETTANQNGSAQRMELHTIGDDPNDLLLVSSGIKKMSCHKCK